jgi:hypothetical protein
MLNFSSMWQKLDDRVAEMRLETYPALSIGNLSILIFIPIRTEGIKGRILRYQGSVPSLA